MSALHLNGVDDQEAAELQSSIGYDEAADTRVRRKLDWHLMPLFFILCK